VFIDINRFLQKNLSKVLRWNNNLKHMNITCEKCGGSNSLPEGRTSMFCAFCGSLIEMPIEKTIIDENPLKTKPTITERKVRTWTETVPAYPGGETIRVSGGFITNDEAARIGARWGMSDIFIPDEVEHHEKVLDEGGELRLTNKGIRSFKNVTDWFTDSELESIRVLDLSNNQICDLTGIERLKNVKVINLSNNKINKFPQAVFQHLQSIDLSNNLLPTIQPLFFSPAIRTVILDNNSISDLQVDSNNINAVKARFLTVDEGRNIPALKISLTNNPIKSLELFSEIVKVMSVISPKDFSMTYKEKELVEKLNNVKERTNSSTNRDFRIESAHEFKLELEKLHSKRYIINKVEIVTDQDLRSIGFEKSVDGFFYQINYPHRSVILDAVKSTSKFSGDIESLMEETSTSMDTASRKQVGASITLVVYAILCIILFFYSKWIFYIQLFIIGIPVLIICLLSFFKKDD
jgi:hypothetical protein